MPADGPVFIAGLDRSGKTPLRALLDGLPDITFVRRAYLWTELYERYGDVDDDAHLASALAALRRHPELRLSEGEVATVKAQLPRGTRGYPRLFAAAMGQVAARAGTTRWGVQEALVEVRADAILSDDPQARFVHLVRDPRDRHVAAYAHGGSTPWRVGVSAARWRTSALLAIDHAARHPDAYLVIRYEDLVAAPGRTLRAVCDFIGSAPTAPMLDAAETWAATAGGTVGTGAAGLRPSAVRYLQRRLAEPMRAFGYDEVNTRASFTSPIADAATRAIARAAAWQWGDRDLRPESRTGGARKLAA
ncbi:MAG TPA: sulfotransferase [Candidatus Limnocylindria bacterium]